MLLVWFAERQADALARRYPLPHSSVNHDRDSKVPRDATLTAGSFAAAKGVTSR